LGPHKGFIDVSTNGFSGDFRLNVGKRPKSLGRGRKSYIHLAQEKVACDVVASRQLSLDGFIRELNTLERVTQCCFYPLIVEGWLAPPRSYH
jgi:hypothetical protein